MLVTFLDGTRAEVTLCPGVYLRNADLRGEYLFGANLSGAILSGAILSSADLRGANLFGADLRDAYLSGANLRGANLSGSNLFGARNIAIQVGADPAMPVATSRRIGTGFKEAKELPLP